MADSNMKRSYTEWARDLSQDNNTSSIVQKPSKASCFMLANFHKSEVVWFVL